jgi:hypothetical protein
VGTFRPTGRNHLVRQHYAHLGFTQTARHEDGTTEWVLDVNTARVKAAPMVVRRTGFELAAAELRCA